MPGDAAFDTALFVGIRQIETNTVICPTGAITGSGDLHLTCTSALLGGGTEVIDVAVLITDTEIEVAAKIVAAANLNADYLDHFLAVQGGVDVIHTTLLPAANEGAQDFALAQDDATGLTADVASANTLAGAVLTEVARVSNFSGPSFSADTEDVTAHDTAAPGWEEVIATILRTGELKLDIYYDPDGATHDATTGLIYKYENVILGYYQLRFPDAGKTEFTFDAYVIGFESTEPVGGALTAAVSLKITGVPSLTDTWA